MSVSGSAVQQDGFSASLTAPNGMSQRRLIGAVWAGHRRGGTALEAHGTGTALGDPIEVGAAQALHAPVECNPDRVTFPHGCTSSKSTMGHLEPAAAAAGLASLLVTSGAVIPTNAQLRQYPSLILGRATGSDIG